MTRVLENETRIAAGTANDKRLTLASSIEIVAGSLGGKPVETLVITTSEGVFECSRADGGPMSDEEINAHIAGVQPLVAEALVADSKKKASK